VATTTVATTAATVEKMSSMNLGDLKTNVDGLGSNMNETTASTTVASGLKTVESAVPHAALDGAFEGPGSKMNETAASNYVANLPVEKLEELLAAKKAEASTMMQLNPAKLAVEILPLESQPHKHTPQMGLNESLDREVGGADVIFSTPSRSKVTLHPTTADSPRCSPRRSPRQKSPAPTKPSYHRRSIAKVRRAQEGELPSDFPTGPWKDANEGYQEIGNIQGIQSVVEVHGIFAGVGLSLEHQNKGQTKLLCVQSTSSHHRVVAKPYVTESAKALDVNGWLCLLSVWMKRTMFVGASVILNVTTIIT